MNPDCDAYRFRFDIAVECGHIVFVNGNGVRARVCPY